MASGPLCVTFPIVTRGLRPDLSRRQGTLIHQQLFQVNQILLPTESRLGIRVQAIPQSLDDCEASMQPTGDGFCLAHVPRPDDRV